MDHGFLAGLEEINYAAEHETLAIVNKGVQIYNLMLNEAEGSISFVDGAIFESHIGSHDIDGFREQLSVEKAF